MADGEAARVDVVTMSDGLELDSRVLDMDACTLFIGVGSKREYAYDGCAQGYCSAASEELFAGCNTFEWTEDVLVGRPAMYVHWCGFHGSPLSLVDLSSTLLEEELSE